MKRILEAFLIILFIAMLLRLVQLVIEECIEGAQEGIERQVYILLILLC